MRRLLTGTLAVTTATALGAFALPAGSQAFGPVSYRVVTTVLDPGGRPVFSVRETRSRPVVAAAGVEFDVPVRALEVSQDPYRAQQWDLDAIGVTAAWGRSKGAGVTVAVIDTGVDAGHPDLAGNVLTGYDAINEVAGGGTDENGHGTHVAGTIAAVAGNGIGVSGVAPGARILPVKALGANGSGWMSDTAEGIVWAADHGAQVINLSLGAPERSEAVSAAVAYARGRGVTVVAAAGNERTKGSPVNHPAADEGVIAVAATGADGRIAEFSNAGGHVDVAAPGSGILSTYPGALGTEYGLMSGTSMAAPHVAAVAALILGADRATGPDQVEELLESTALDHGDAGFDPDFGHGLINAAAALGAEAVTPQISYDGTPRSVAYGTRTATGFTVRAGAGPWANRPVSACFSAAGGAWNCRAVTTDARGGVLLSRVATGAFRVRLDVPQTTASATVGYAVRAVVKATRTGKGAIAVRVAGASGQTMSMQRYVSRKWKTVRTYRATAGRKVTGLASGGSYRFVVAGTKTVNGVTSGTVKA